MDYNSTKKSLSEIYTDAIHHPLKTCGILLIAIVILIGSVSITTYVSNFVSEHTKGTVPTTEPAPPTTPIVIYSPLEKGGSYIEKRESEDLVNNSNYKDNIINLSLKYTPIPNSIDINWGEVHLPLDSFVVIKNNLTIYKDKITFGSAEFSDPPVTSYPIHVTYLRTIQ